MKLCDHLRCKSLYGARWRTEDELDAALLRNDVPFSCLKTCASWGPDDDLVAPERCQPERGCFRLSPRQPPGLQLS